MIGARESGARETYDAFAEVYDDFNHRYMYRRWSARLLARARAAGLEGDRLLDVGCGSGLSFLGPLADGWKVCGCDVSPEMIAKARERVGDAAELRVADMRTLPRLGEFDLVWAVNDAINYLLSPAELQSALTGLRRNLAPGGVVVFDVNTLATYLGPFAEEVVVERAGRRMVWGGYASVGDGSPGSIFVAGFEGEGAGVIPHVHRQRHFPEVEILAATRAAGLGCIEVCGERDGALEPGLDEDTHTKAVYVCRAAEARGRRPPRV
jgi:SAM-dependent methyltransferase